MIFPRIYFLSRFYQIEIYFFGLNLKLTSAFAAKNVFGTENEKLSCNFQVLIKIFDNYL